VRYAVVPVPKQAPSYLPGLALMATTPGRRRLSRHIEQEGGVSPKIATPRLRSAERLFLRQRPNLCLERCPRPDQIADHPTNEPAKVIHKSMSDSRSIASRIRFATRTRIFLAGLRANCYCSFDLISCRRDVFRSDPHAWNLCSYEVMRRFPGSYGSDVRPTWPKPRPAIS